MNKVLLAFVGLIPLMLLACLMTFILSSVGGELGAVVGLVLSFFMGVSYGLSVLGPALIEVFFDE